MHSQRTINRILWFVALWLAGVGTVMAMAYVIRLVLL